MDTTRTIAAAQTAETHFPSGFDANGNATAGAVTMTPKDQLALWTALNTPAELTTAQKKLGELMRGGG